jgi:PAS domain S-box-containing protein
MKNFAGFSDLVLPVSAAFDRGGLLSSLLSRDYLPHRYCYRAEPGLVWTNVTSDAMIGVSYVVIFVCLLWIANRLHTLPQLRGFIWIFLAFGTFILSCAVTHWMELTTVWLPFYPLSAALKVACAAVSIPTAILLVRVAPAVVANISRFFDLLTAAQRATEDAVADYRGQVEAINRSQMMIEFNMDGTIIRANENYLRVFGNSDDDVEGKDHSIFLIEEHQRSAAYTEIWNGLRKGVFQSGLFMLIDKRGNEVWIEASYNPVLGPDGSPSKVVKFASNVTERIKFQNHLKDTEARLLAILNSVVDGIITIDGMGRIVSFNPAATRMFEYEESEVAGKNIKMLMPEPNRGAHDGYLARHQSTGKSAAIGVGRELEGLTRTGRTFPMELTVTEMSLHGRKFFVGLVRDISERSRQEKALRKSEDFLDRTGRLAAVGGWELDLLTNEVNWSNETRRLHGFENDYVPTLEEGINFYAPEARPVIRAAIEKAIAGGKDWEVVVPVIRVDGSRIWARVTATVQFADGKPVRLAGAFQDVTSRVAEQDALREAIERAALAAESCGISIWDWDMRSGIVRCDPLMYRLYGLEPECEVQFDVGYWRGHMHPDDRLAEEQAFQDGIAGIRPYDTEFRIVWDDGSIHHIRATGKVTRDANGNAIRIFGTNMEITASKLAEEALRRSNKELDEFAYAASHDLKAPLRVIDNASKWLEEDLEPYLTAETRESMSLLRGRVARMEKLLDDLLEYSRIGRKTSERHAEILSADKLMENILGLVSIPEGFTVSLSSTLAGIPVRRMPLQQVLINLVGNAIKHHDKKSGCIEVSVEDLGAQLEFKVRDDGPGIPAQFHEQIFKMFQTLKPRDQVEGSGMGLAMVRKHVEFSGGTVAVESAEGQGSTFRFTWPKQQPIEEEPL